MDEAPRLLRHYRLNMVEVWIGYGVATMALLLWSSVNRVDELLVFVVYIGILIATAMCSVVIIERRRPWPFGAGFEPLVRVQSLLSLVSSFVGAISVGVLNRLLEPAGIAIAVAVPLGLGFLFVSFTYMWAPLTYRMYPYLRAAHGKTI